MRYSTLKFAFACLSATALLALPSCAQNAAPQIVAAPNANGKMTETAATATPNNYPDVPGTVIFHSPASSKLFVGSPGIAILPNGDYVAKNDEFGFGIEDTRAITRVFGSSDKGVSWKPLSVVNNCFWSSIFVNESKLYMLGTSKQYGKLVIFRSNDGGVTWTEPTDENNGVLRSDGKFHTAPMPVVIHDGRIWRAAEDANGPGGWGSMFRAFMMSAPVDADLLKASSWTSSNPLERDATWNNNDFGGWLEGNAVVTREGNIVDILRVATGSPVEKAAIIRISKDGKTATFDDNTDLVELPGASKKFTIRFDPQTNKYWSLANVIPDKHKGGNPGGIRNTQGLISSTDLKNWTVNSVLLYNPDVAKHGFQYVDWQFDGNDIVAAARTAFDDEEGGARNNHDANFLTFHRVKNFRTMTMKDGIQIPKQAAVHVETPNFDIDGAKFEMAPLTKGSKIYSNRDYTWINVPDQFSGGKFTRMGGGVASEISVTAKKDGMIYFATALSQPGVDVRGWTPTGDTLNYSDGGKTEMTVFGRTVKAGDEVKIPQGNWVGSAVLVEAQ